ncbi:hypothetical protein F4825DRAFT_452289 [Nemania diffusa]|nr:hypothetical protein F4825DRAFT_452289 [Nemania diffusa]
MKRILFISLSQLLWAQAVVAMSMILLAGHDTPLCSARSEAPSMFSIRNIRYSLQNPPTMAHFQFDVTNPATHYTTRCSLDGAQLTPAPSGNGSVDDMWTPCENRTVAPGEERTFCLNEN